MAVGTEHQTHCCAVANVDGVKQGRATQYKDWLWGLAKGVPSHNDPVSHSAVLSTRDVHLLRAEDKFVARSQGNFVGASGAWGVGQGILWR